MKKPDLNKLKQQARELKERATGLGSEAAKTARGVHKGVKTGVEVSKIALQKASEVINRETVGTGLDTVAKGAEAAGKSLGKASSALKRFSKKIKR